MAIDVTREDFWRAQHISEDSFWLTGTRLAPLLVCYGLAEPEGLDITEIGVGLRYVTKALAARNRVTAVDLIEEAIAPTRAYSTGLLIHDLQQARPADLAICHLVFQHCASDMVARILDVPLKPDGVFAFQTVYLLDRDDGGWDPLRIVWHPREEILTLAEKANLVPFWENYAETAFDGAAVGVSYFKCRRRTT